MTRPFLTDSHVTELHSVDGCTSTFSKTKDYRNIFSVNVQNREENENSEACKRSKI